jgi:hypothetical protein
MPSGLTEEQWNKITVVSLWHRQGPVGTGKFLTDRPSRAR